MSKKSLIIKSIDTTQTRKVIKNDHDNNNIWLVKLKPHDYFNKMNYQKEIIADVSMIIFIFHSEIICFVYDNLSYNSHKSFICHLSQIKITIFIIILSNLFLKNFKVLFFFKFNLLILIVFKIHLLIIIIFSIYIFLFRIQNVSICQLNQFLN